MPPALQREEFYWDGQKLTSATVTRSSKMAHWPPRAREMVVAIEDLGDQRTFEYGDAATPTLVSRAYVRYRSLECDPRASDIGSFVPPGLLNDVTAACEQVTEKLVRQYRAVGNEERATGILVGDLNGMIFKEDGWEATIHVQGFSTNLKEPFIGADVGITVDIRHGRKRVVKALLGQAKRVDEMPADPRQLEDVPRQLRDMSHWTDESYVLICGPDGVEMRHGTDLMRPLTVAGVVGDTILCSRGDRNPLVVGEAVERNSVLEVSIAGPNALWPFTPGTWPQVTS